MKVIQLDSRRAPHPEHAQRFAQMERRRPSDLAKLQKLLRQAHHDPVMRAQIVA
jgi:hypothetical protein